FVMRRPFRDAMRSIFSTEPLTITSVLLLDAEVRWAIRSDDRRARCGPASADAGSCNRIAATSTAATCQIKRSSRQVRRIGEIGCVFDDDIKSLPRKL